MFPDKPEDESLRNPLAVIEGRNEMIEACKESFGIFY